MSIRSAARTGIVLALLYAGHACAATLTLTPQAISLNQAHGWSGNVFFSQFTPANGLLESVTVSFVASAQASPTVEYEEEDRSHDRDADSVSVTLSSSVNLKGPGNLALGTLTPGDSALVAFPGMEEGEKQVHLHGTQSTSVVLTDPLVLQHFIGGGQVGLQVSGNAWISTLFAPGEAHDFELEFEDGGKPRIGAIVGLKYGYQELGSDVGETPEPGTLALAGSALIGLALYSRRRARNR